jgi:imidazolonepropionase-like amidohydrolase
MFFRAGGKIAMGTDAGTPFNHHGSNAAELRYMVDYGVSTAGALIATTASAAALMDLKQRGRIADGMIADVLIVKGNPLDNIDAVADTDNHLWLLKNGITVKTSKTNVE